MTGNLYFDQTTPWQGVYFFTNTVKEGTVRVMHCCIVILVVGFIINYVYIQTVLKPKKRAMNILGTKILALLVLQQCSTDC